MQRRLLSMLAFAAASAVALPVQAQMWFDTAAIMQPVVLNPCPGARCPGAGSNGDTGDAATLASDPAGSATAAVDLTYAPSIERRRANLAEFVARTRADNPESATQMEELFASTDVIGQVGSALAPYGYSVADLGDAYAFWWMTAWEGTRGFNRAFSQSEMQAVQEQAHHALASTSQIAQSTDAQKQQMAEALWIQASMIDGLVDMAEQQPGLMSQLQAAIRQGALASGVNLDAMQLTPRGFTSR
ncbi:hypothetical protein PK98_14470 [Croceibacterium mercuriale]|uniref:Uncharacterized protein n=1 Tax=Croceibacterium mercuriale TaxID=1572751 RepID=A0A0B2BX56_9SPHN|nr:DUF6683 family protein [Croceibacterium mercuriale]KHL24201.1 hypothetical protein PK98_14470 [Croceibacterium mercuriale]